MLKTLNLVRGAVSTQTLIPAMTHFYINGEQIQSTNGRITIDAWGPDTGIQALVPAERFLKAIGDGESKLVFILDGDKLVIKKGRLRVTIHTLPLKDFPIVDNFDGDSVQFDGGLLAALRRLVPFIANDASRPWANSVMIRDGYAYATSNPLLARVPFDTDRQLILPTHLITEMLRIGETPAEILITQGTVSVIYDTFRIRAQQVMGEWPTQLVALVDRLQNAQMIEVPAGLFEAVEELKPFFPDPKIPIVEFGPEGVSTKEGIHSAMVEECGLPVSIYRYESLITMLSVATHADFNAYPDPVPFRGEDGIEGILCGLRQSKNV